MHIEIKSACRGGKKRCRFSSRFIAVVLDARLYTDLTNKLNARLTHHLSFNQITRLLK